MSVYSSIDPTGTLFACLSADGRLRVFETATSKKIIEHVSDASLANAYTCLAWNPVADQPASVIALGSRSGHVFMFDIAKSEIVSELKGHLESVNAVLFSPSGETLYSCSNDKHVFIWDLESSTSSSRFQADDHRVTALSLCSEGKNLLTAGRNVKLWDLNTKKTIKTFSGQEESITQIVMYPNGNQFLTFDTVGRFANVWNLKGKVTHTVGAIALQAASRCIAATKSVSPEMLCNVVAVSNTDEVRVWEVPAPVKGEKAKNSGKKSKQPVFSCTFVNKGDEAANAKKIPVLFADFAVSAGVSELVVVRGSPLRPMVEILPYRIGSKWAESGPIKRVPVQMVAGSQQASLDAKAKKAKSADESAHIIGAENTRTNVPMALDEQFKSSTKDKETMDVDEPVLGDILDSENQPEQLGVSSKKGRGKANKADSLAKLLTQALHSDDSTLLEECLANTNEHVVRNTIQHLPTPYVVPFLEVIVAKFQSKPVRGIQLVPWIKTIMIVHTSYLMTVPNLAESLGGLSSLIDSRLSAFRKLLALNGRLDLLLSQISVQAQLEGVSGLKEHAVVFRDEDSTESESQSEDEDADDDMVEYSGDSDEEFGSEDEDSDGEE
eukprot:CFRG1009T1